MKRKHEKEPISNFARLTKGPLSSSSSNSKKKKRIESQDIEDSLFRNINRYLLELRIKQMKAKHYDDDKSTCAMQEEQGVEEVNVSEREEDDDYDKRCQKINHPSKNIHQIRRVE